MVRRGCAPLSSALGLALTLAAGPAVGLPPPEFTEALARGNEHYARRAEGARGPLAPSHPVEDAIADYRRALNLQPASTEARFRLLRALFFRAKFCGGDAEERKRLSEEARDVANEGLKRLEQATGVKPGALSLPALRRVPGAGELLYWCSVAWGEWALNHNRLAAAGAGAPRRVRDLAQAVVDLDPGLEEGGGYRILGRLHDQCPSVPLVSGWVSRQTALDSLRKAYAAFPDNAVNQLFLAEAILRHQPAQREEARALLARLASAPPRDEYRVEQAYYVALARERLSSLGGR